MKKRPDGILVKDEVPMYYLIPHFLRHRYDAMNMVTVDIPVDPLREFMNAKRREGKSVSHMALIMAAYTRMAYEFPSVNRFIAANGRIYQHKDFTVSLVVLRPGGGNDDTMDKLYFNYSDTVFDVQDKINAFVEKNASGTTETGLDRWMARLCRLNGLMRAGTGLICWLDRHSMLPKALVKVSPFHASLLISNLASIRTNHIYHHIYEFGTTSVAITIGNLREIPKRGPGGSTKLERCIPLGIVMDERIASGHYFALAFSRLKELLANPSLLEIAPEGDPVPRL